MPRYSLPRHATLLLTAPLLTAPLLTSQLTQPRKLPFSVTRQSLGLPVDIFVLTVELVGLVFSSCSCFFFASQSKLALKHTRKKIKGGEKVGEYRENNVRAGIRFHEAYLFGLKKSRQMTTLKVSSGLKRIAYEGVLIRGIRHTLFFFIRTQFIRTSGWDFAKN